MFSARKGCQPTTKNSTPGYLNLRSSVGPIKGFSICPKSKFVKKSEVKPGPGHYNPIHLYEIKNKKFGKFGKAHRDNFESIYGNVNSLNQQPRKY